MKELNAADRSSEAESEMQRISPLADSVVPVSAWAVSFAMKRKDYGEAIALAEQLTIRNPEDAEGWLLRAQATFAAGSSLDTKEKIQELYALSWSHLEKAHALSAGKNISVWDAKFRFKQLVGDKAGATELLQNMLKETGIDEQIRLREVGRHYFALREYGLARQCFENSLLLNPLAADVHLSLADLCNAIGDEEGSLTALRKAYQAAPGNDQIRERLAISLAFSSSGSDMKEVDALFAKAQPTTRASVIRALIDLSRGDERRKFSAVKSLRELSSINTPEGLDAKRLLANHYANLWKNATLDQSQLASESFELARRLYEDLLLEAKPNPNDVARYIALILDFDAKAKESHSDTSEDFLGLAARALEKLESLTGSSIASLQLRVRLAKARGESQVIGSIAEKMGRKCWRS